MERLVIRCHFWKDKASTWKKSFLGPFDNCQGQTLVTWLVMLSMILLITICFGSALNFIQDRRQLTHICRLESLKTQVEVEPLIKKLFALNPQARFLRVLMISAQARLAIAVSTLNIPMAAHAKKDIMSIRRQQQKLDQIQTTLIETANAKLHFGTLSTYMKIKKALQEIKTKSLKWADFEFLMKNPKIPKLAVRAEDRKIAPVYLAKKNFEKVQATSQFWTQNYRLKGYLETSHSFEIQCSATLEEHSWISKIRRDRL